MNPELAFLNTLQQIHTPWLDAAMVGITTLGNKGAVWVVLALVLLAISKTRKAGLAMAIALLAGFLLCNGLLKPLVARTRPCDVLPSIALIIPRPEDFSFPSGHTTASFIAVTVLVLYRTWLPRRWQTLWVPTLVLAVLIAFSRMYIGVHYPTDILGGIVLGVACGWVGYLAMKGRKARRGSGY